MSDSIELVGLNKTFGEVVAVNDVSLDVRPGELLTLLGPSGCGKTTLLRLLSGFEQPTRGFIRISGQDVTPLPPHRRDINQVFQSYALFPHLNVRDNIAFGLKMQGLPVSTIAERVARVTALVDLRGLESRFPSELSGGQRQRVAIGRAIVRKPEVFLFDEPLSNLDAELRVQMRIEIARLHQELKSTMIYVTHDQVEAMTLASRIVVLRAGRIEQVGAPLDLYENPDNMFVGGFIGSPRMNFVKATVSGRAGDRAAMIEAPEVGLRKAIIATRGTPPAPGTAVSLGIRPEHFLASGSQAGIEGRITVVERLGAITYVHASLADGTALTIESRDAGDFSQGQQARFGFDAARGFLFDADGKRI
jgi:lactose/L-arabinose transport system ATP-binding protein